MIRNAIVAFLVLVAMAGCAARPATDYTLIETDFAYGPPSIVVPVGKPVTLTFVNNGAVEHDFVIQSIDVSNVSSDTAGDHHHDMTAAEYDLHTSTLPGETNVLIFTPEQAGRYEYFCTVKGHKEAGMIGTMTVVSE